MKTKYISVVRFTANPNEATMPILDGNRLFKPNVFNQFIRGSRFQWLKRYQLLPENVLDDFKIITELDCQELMGRKRVPKCSDSLNLEAQTFIGQLDMNNSEGRCSPYKMTLTVHIVGQHTEADQKSWYIDLVYDYVFRSVYSGRQLIKVPSSLHKRIAGAFEETLNR